MKKLFVTALIFSGLIFVAVSCRHEPLNPTTGSTPPGGTGGGTPAVTCSPDTAYFQQQVLPIFISNCALSGCHNAASHQNGVILTDYANIITTGDVRPGRPDNSKIWKLITETDPAKRMPKAPRSPLSQEQKDLISKWITQGAKNNSCQAASACDTANVTFSGTIKTILNNTCTGCHGNTAPQANINLTTYAGVKAKVDDGRLWGSINQLPGFSAMPKGGAKLSDCGISQFRKWIAAGAPNN